MNKFKRIVRTGVLFGVLPTCLLATPTAPRTVFTIQSAYSKAQSPLLADISPMGEIITFIDFPGEGSIQVFSEAGDEIIRMPVLPGQQAQTWPLTDKWGQLVAGGLYVYRIEAGGRSIVGEIFIDNAHPSHSNTHHLTPF
jgi:hypothetical protein